MSAICQIHYRICLKISTNINLCLLYKYISYTAVFCAFYFDQDRKRDKRMCVLLHRSACIVNTWSHMQTRVHIFLSSRAVIFFFVCMSTAVIIMAYQPINTVLTSFLSFAFFTFPSIAKFVALIAKFTLLGFADHVAIATLCSWMC
jgi:hypothetical protein